MLQSWLLRFILLTAVQQTAQHPIKFISWVIMQQGRVVFLYFAYWYVYTYHIATPPIPLAEALGAFALYTLIVVCGFRSVFSTITSDIKSGALEIELVRPYTYWITKVTSRAGVSLVYAVLLLPVLFVSVYWFAGLPYVTPSSILLLAVSMTLGLMLTALLYALIAVTALWLDDAEPVYYVVDKSAMVLGGAFIPIALLPVWLQNFALFTPMGAIYLGTQGFSQSFVANAPLFISVQLAWVVVLYIVIVFAYRAASQHISVNGG